ncbi:hypothetical protein Aduo_016201 [Ancylostoma duodenale]
MVVGASYGVTPGYAPRASPHRKPRRPLGCPRTPISARHCCTSAMPGTSAVEESAGREGRAASTCFDFENSSPELCYSAEAAGEGEWKEEGGAAGYFGAAGGGAPIDPEMAVALLGAPRSSNMNYRKVDPYEEHDDDGIFFSKYRFHKRDMDVLERMLSPLVPDNGFEPWWIPKRTQILMAIRYLSNNSFRSSVGDVFGVCQKTVSNVILAVVRALNHPEVVGRFMRFYSDSEQWCAQRAAEFAQQCRFSSSSNLFPFLHPMHHRTFISSNNIGAIDGCIITLQQPRAHGWQYFCRKSCTAVNMVAITDARGLFLYVDCRFPARCHDSAIWSRSVGSGLFEDADTAPGYHLLGGSGFGNSASIVTPNRDTAARHDERKENFDVELSHARIVAEQAFGALERGFPILYNIARLNIRRYK